MIEKVNLDGMREKVSGGKVTEHSEMFFNVFEEGSKSPFVTLKNRKAAEFFDLILPDLTIDEKEELAFLRYEPDMRARLDKATSVADMNNILQSLIDEVNERS